MVTIRESGAVKTKDTWETLNRPVFYVTNRVTTHVVRLKLFRLKAEGVRRAQLPYFDGNV